MSSIETKVKVTCGKKGVQDLSLPISHAERLLQINNNGGWKLPKDSKFELKKNGLIKRTNTRDPKDSKE